MGGPRVDESARPVVVEAAVPHDRQRLSRQRLGLVPVVALDGDDASLGQGHRNEGHDAGTRRLVRGASEVQVGLVEVTLEQIGRPHCVEHGRPVRAQSD